MGPQRTFYKDNEITTVLDTTGSLSLSKDLVCEKWSWDAIQMIPTQKKEVCGFVFHQVLLFTQTSRSETKIKAFLAVNH